jgi:hypothetical protein
VPEALLIMDFQGGFLGLFDDPGPVVARAAAALDAARRTGRSRRPTGCSASSSAGGCSRGPTMSRCPTPWRRAPGSRW